MHLGRAKQARQLTSFVAAGARHFINCYLSAMAIFLFLLHI